MKNEEFHRGMYVLLEKRLKNSVCDFFTRIFMAHFETSTLREQELMKYTSLLSRYVDHRMDQKDSR